MQIKFPRGRTPTDSTKLKYYIQNVAAMNGCTYETAEKAFFQRGTDSPKIVPFPKAPTKGLIHPELTPSAPKVVVAKKVSDAERLEMISSRFDMLYSISRACAQGQVRALIVSGPGGVGKSYGMESILEDYKEKKNIQYEIVKGVLTPINLFKLLYNNREKHHVVVLDDADGIFYDDQSLALLKAACDSSIRRRLDWRSESNVLKSEEIPPSFLFYGSMIFVTNIDFQSYIDNGRGKLAPHLKALINRAHYLDLPFESNDDMVLWIAHVVSKNGVLVQAGITKDQESQVLGFMREHADEMRNLSIRTALKISDFVKMDPHDWRKMAKAFECRV